MTTTKRRRQQQWCERKSCQRLTNGWILSVFERSARRKRGLDYSTGCALAHRRNEVETEALRFWYASKVVGNIPSCFPETFAATCIVLTTTLNCCGPKGKEGCWEKERKLSTRNTQRIYAEGENCVQYYCSLHTTKVQAWRSRNFWEIR